MKELESLKIQAEYIQGGIINLQGMLVNLGDKTIYICIERNGTKLMKLVVKENKNKKTTLYSNSLEVPNKLCFSSTKIPKEYSERIRKICIQMKKQFKYETEIKLAQEKLKETENSMTETIGTLEKNLNLTKNVEKMSPLAVAQFIQENLKATRNNRASVRINKNIIRVTLELGIYLSDYQFNGTGYQIDFDRWENHDYVSKTPNNVEKAKLGAYKVLKNSQEDEILKSISKLEQVFSKYFMLFSTNSSGYSYLQIEGTLPDIKYISDDLDNMIKTFNDFVSLELI